MVNKFHYLKGGSETYHFLVGESLERMGHEVAWFAMRDERNLPCDQSGYFVTPRDYTGASGPARKLADGLALVYSLEAKRRFNALLEEFRPDVIHLNLVHRQITFSILDAPYLRGRHVPVVYTAHDYVLVCPSCTMLDGGGRVCDDCLPGSFAPCVRKRCVKASRAKSALAAAEARFLRLHGSYRKIDRIIAPSDFMRGKLLDGGFPPGQVVTMQNPAGDQVLEAARSREDRTNRESPYFLFFGRLSGEKGIDVLVDAFLAVAGDLPGWRLVIAGEGPARASIEARAAGGPLGARVELVGFKSGGELERLVSGASFAVVSSRWRDNMPFSIVEAFAAGTPVIGSGIGGIPELVAEGETGLLCEPGDARSLASRLASAASLCGDREAYRRMQSRCRSYVLDHCDRRRYMGSLVSLYQDLMTKDGCR